MKYRFRTFTLGTLFVVQLSGAAIIKVYDTKGGGDYDAMALVAEALRERHLAAGEPEAAVAGEVDGFGYRIVPGSRATAELSLAPGSSSYFWSSTSYAYEPGFNFKGGTAVFRTAAKPGSEALAKEALDKPPVAYATALSSASVSGGSLRLRYSLAQPATVSLRIATVDGKVVGDWRWRDGTGLHFRTVDARLAHGVYLVNWSSGDVRWATRLTYDGSR